MKSAWFRIAAVAMVILAVVCSRIPLFNYLGFEFSTVTAIAGAFVSGLCFLIAQPANLRGSRRDYWKGIGRFVLAALALTTLPGLLMLGNVVYVKNCSIADGAFFYGILVYPSVVFAVGLASMLSILLTRLQKIAFAGLFVLVLLQIAAVTLLRPQVFAFNPIAGYFPGFTYDESLQVMNRLAVYRLVTLGAAATLFAAAGAVHWRRRGRAGHTHASWPLSAEWVVIALCAPACIVVFMLSDRIGFSSSESFIRTKLGGSYESTRLEFVYPAGSVRRDEIVRAAIQQEEALDRMKETLGLGAIERITVFVYATAEQKGRLIGALRTDLAKPWLRQVHVNAGDIQQVLTHELVHVVASDFGFSPLKIGRNPGLIEGLAVAMEGRAYEEPLPTAAAMALSAGSRLDLERLFSFSGFATATPGVAYTVAGAFCRSLIDSRGASAFRRLYASGNFEEVYGSSLQFLLSEWRKSLDSVEMDPGAHEKALYLFRRPSIFTKECARVIADRNNLVTGLLNANRFEEALSTSEATLALSKSPEALYQRARALAALNQFRILVRTSEEALRDSVIGHSMLPLRLRLGDAYWSIGELDSADAQYARLRAAHLSSRYDELTVIRQEAMRTKSWQSAFWSVLTREIPDSVRRSSLKEIAHPLGRYLLAQEYLLLEQYREAAGILASLEAFPIRELEYHRLRRLGRARFELGEFSSARITFQHALLLARPGERLEIEDWIRRCEHSESRS